MTAGGTEMSDHNPPVVAIVDYGLGNLFSVARACERAGLVARVTSDKREVLSADGVILPGVGAFGDAMQNLRQLDLISPLRQIAHSDTPLLGVCLGQQLLMTESEEFGVHQGLNIVPGRVVHFGRPRGPRGVLKVPQVGWNRVHRPPGADDDPWQGTPLSGLADGTYMYFVHSFYVCPDDTSLTLSISRYGDIEFCSAIRWRNVVAFQYHPERSGTDGMSIYQNFARDLCSRQFAKEHQNAA